MRVLNIVVIGVLILAAAFVYKIKFDSTLQAETVAKLRGELRRERDAIALLRAEWTKLQTPARLEALAKRHLALKPVEPTQFDNFEHLLAASAGTPAAALLSGHLSNLSISKPI